MFEGDIKLNFHLAPPILAGKPLANGRPRKKTYGPSMMTAFRMLAKLRKLRGTPLDLFGYSYERKRERKLIREYETVVGELVKNLSTENRRFALSLAKLPDEIRGFGPVKEKAMDTAEEKKKALLERFRNPTADNQSTERTDRLEAAE